VLGEPRIHVDRCESTQLLLDPSLPEGAIATAAHQTGGRGRLGRSWQDVPGRSLLVSVLLKPSAGRHPAELTLVGGLAVARAIGPDARIKWPNDVLVDGRKVSGGLADLRDGAVILGIGVNVNQTAAELPPDTRTPAASLRTVRGSEQDVEGLLAGVLRELDEAYGVWRAAGLAALHGALAERDFLRGREVAVDGLRGIARGIGADGRLELDTPEGTAAVDSGEVLFFAP
jgi:BirA family biotin operon repressor/biotin-[acetyl-CoA-carboxylase] ligase